MTYDTINDATTLRGDMSSALGCIDQYELLRELGGGGFGSVYLARDTVAGIEVAVKGLPPIIRNNAEELERIRENFALISRLHHPYIAAALHLHRAQKVRYSDESVREKLRVLAGDTLMVMEYAPGVTLSKWRKQFPGGKVPLEQAIQLVWQIAQALDYAHEQHIIHRDIKPSNIIVETKPDGEVVARLLDFGLAAEIRSSMGRVSREIRDTSGTRPYMAPEQWAGRKQGPATDQYALAVLLCELLTGEVPFASAFETGDPVVMMMAVCKREAELPMNCPRRGALLRALSKDPSQRFDSCMNFIETASNSEVQQQPATAEGFTFQQKNRKPILLRFSKKIIVSACIGLAVAFVVLATCVVSAYRTKQATRKFLAAYEAKNHDEAARLVKRADTSDAHVQYTLGMMYWHGNGVASNDTESVRWLTRAAEQRYYKAQLFLGLRYGAGDGVVKDEDRAAHWLRAAAEQGGPALQVLVGMRFRDGEGVAKNEVEAVKLFRMAAEQGCAEAQYLLGLCFARGEGVVKDKKEAVKWYRHAAWQGHAQAQLCLGVVLMAGIGVDRDVADGLNWIRKAAEQNNADAQYTLGGVYEGVYKEGQGVAKDDVEAMKWYRKAAECGNEEAKRRIVEIERQAIIERMAENERKMGEDASGRVFEEAEDSHQGEEGIADMRRGRHGRRHSRSVLDEQQKGPATLQHENAEGNHVVQSQKPSEKASKISDMPENTGNEVANELNVVLFEVKKMWRTMLNEADWAQTLLKLDNLEKTITNDIPKMLVRDRCDRIKCMKMAESYLWSNVAGRRVGPPYNGVIDYFDPMSQSFFVKSKMGQGEVSFGYNRIKLFSDRQLKPLLSGVCTSVIKKEIIGLDQVSEPSVKIKVLLGTALIAKNFVGLDASLQDLVQVVAEKIILNNPSLKEKVDRWLFDPEFMDYSVPISPRPKPHVDERAQYTRDMIDSFSFDIAQHFQIGPSLRKRIRTIETTDKCWNAAKVCKEQKNYLGVLSALSGKSFSAYPDAETINAIFKNIRHRKLTIVLGLDGREDIKVFRIKVASANGAFKEVEAKDESSCDRIDDTQVVVKAKIGEEKGFMVTSSCYYNVSMVKYKTCYTTEKRTLEKKLEHGLISREKFDEENRRMNQEMINEMTLIATTEK